jgi:transcriptional regulator with XRE-family HTH domain
VFPIGSGLREARERLGLTLDEAAAATRIQARHLQALEEERFEQLPEPVYVRGFLREYAGFLGLDPGGFLDEYATRIAAAEPPEPPPPPRRPRLPNLRLTGGAVVVIVGAVVVALLAWRFGGTSGQHLTQAPVVPQTPRAQHGVQRHTPVHKARPAPKPVRPATASLVLVASNGRCWVDAHVGAATGRQLYLGTLEQGQSVHLRAARLWLRLGAPSAVTARLDGRPTALPAGATQIVVTARGLSAASG